MKAILVFWIFLSFAQANDDIHKAVYDLTTGDLKTFEKRLLKGVVAHKAYYAGKFQELEVAVVIHGGAYKFFLRDIKNSEFKTDKKLVAVYPELRKRIRSLAENYDIKFYMCNIGKERHKIQNTNLAKFVELIPNSTLGLIDKQNEGFAYLPLK